MGTTPQKELQRAGKVPSQPLISVITVNYNQSDVTIDFLESARKLKWDHYEIIVVDNGSEVSPGPQIQELYPEVRYVESAENLGFSGGNNLGIKAARGKYFLFVNNDTELTEDLLEKLVRAYESDPKVGMVCPLIRYYDRPDVIQYAGYTEMNPMTARNSTIGQFEVDSGQYQERKYTAFAHGAAMFTSREVIDEVGMMPERFFLYYEELDWSARIRKAGYEIMLEPAALIFHKESMSVGKMSTLKTYYMTRNRILFMRRNAPTWSVIAFLIYWLLVAMPKNLLVNMFAGRWEHVKAVWRGTWWNLYNPAVAKEDKTYVRIGALA